MEKCLMFLIMSSSLCSGHGHLGKLSGLLIGAGQEIHNKVHDVAGAVLGGFSVNVHGHVSHHRQPVQHQPHSGGETIVVVVEETSQDNRGPPQSPYGPQQGHYRPPHGSNPNQEYNTNHGYDSNHGYNPRPNPPVNNGQGSYQNGQNNGYNQNVPSYPNLPGQHHNNNGQGYNQNVPSYPNQAGQHHNNNGQGYNQNDQHGYGNPNNNVINNNPDPNGNEVKNPEQNNPNLNGNYKPTETNNGQQHNDGHQPENTHKETNDKTTKKPEDDGPLFVPLNDYTYGGDKITINAPKRETNKGTTDKIEEDFPIDIRFKDE